MKLLATFTALLCLPVLLPAAEETATKEPSRAELEKLGGFEPFPADPLSFNIQVEVLMVALPEADALALLPQLKDAAKIEKACTTLQEMMVAKRAKLIGWPSLITKSGNRAVIESIDEVRYPIEFSPPVLQLAPPADAAPKPAPAPALAPPPPPKAAGAEKPPEPVAPNDPVKPAEPVPVSPTAIKLAEITFPKPLPIAPNFPFDPATPTTFETKNVGVTLEVEPSLDTNTMRIDMNLAPQHVFFAGQDHHVVESAGHKVAVDQPRFRTNKIATNVTLRSGHALLLGQFRASDQPDWQVFFILRATAVPIK